jgi:hypothetical protein
MAIVVILTRLGIAPDTELGSSVGFGPKNAPPSLCLQGV